MSVNISSFSALAQTRYVWDDCSGMFFLKLHVEYWTCQKWGCRNRCI